MERAKIILSETLFPTSSDQSNIINLPGGRPLIPDSMIYRLTFDPEDDELDDDDYHHVNESQLFTHNQFKSIDHDVNMINVWSSSNWDNQDDHYNNNKMEHDELDEPECSSLTTIKLNVSSLADEIIDSEMNSLKCLQTQSPTNESVTTIKVDHHHYQASDNEVNDETIVIQNHVKSTEQYPYNGKTRMGSSILTSLMRGTINTETSIITYDCPPTRAYLSCCVIS